MVSICKRLINAVTTDKLKMLDGLEPKKAMWWAQGVLCALTRTINTTGGESGPNPSGCS